MSTDTIASVLTEERVFAPSEAFSSAARVPSRDALEALRQRAADDPEGFWGELARAEQALQRALALAPGHPEAQALLDQVQANIE